MEEQQQQWRRRAGRRAAAATSSVNHRDARTEVHSDLPHHNARAPPVNPSHTITSASKVVRKSTTQATDMFAKPRTAPLPPSRWKELRQSVRIKATMEAGARRPMDAKIADLCDEDREKVAKLIRRIVEVRAAESLSPLHCIPTRRRVVRTLATDRLGRSKRKQKPSSVDSAVSWRPRSQSSAHK